MTKEFSPEEYQQWLSEQPKKFIVVKVIMHSDQGNVLIQKPTYKKSWQLPGGGVDAGEDLKDALVREVSEELGITIDKQALQISGTIHKIPDDILFVVYHYTIHLPEDTAFVLPAEELEGYEFVSTEVATERLAPLYSKLLKK